METNRFSAEGWDTHIGHTLPVHGERAPTENCVVEPEVLSTGPEAVENLSVQNTSLEANTLDAKTWATGTMIIHHPSQWPEAIGAENDR